jgi:hypothetical protein
MAIDKAISIENPPELRDHLGASLIGGLCEREIWYSFRWAVKRVFDARMLRLFNRGHREEERFEGWIKAISDNFWSIDPRTGKQIRISDLRGYFGGSLDGVVRNPAGYRGDFLTEFKTHSVKSYEKLVLKGVKVAKPEHYTQMQIYLKYQPKLKGALYFAIQKNDDAIYIEYIERDPEWADIFVDRAKRVILAIEPMQGHNGMSEYHFHCKYFCDYKDVCFGKAAPHVSCRSCAFVALTDDGWKCMKDETMLDSEAQRKGCEKYERGF